MKTELIAILLAGALHVVPLGVLTAANLPPEPPPAEISIDDIPLRWGMGFDAV